MKKKRWMKPFSVALSVIAVYSLLWGIWRHQAYAKYTNHFKEIRRFYSYIKLDEDNYIYSVKKPDILTYVGNLCVATPDDKAALIIWPGAVSGYEYAFQITDENNNMYHIELKENLTPKEPEYKELVNANKEAIDELLERADQMWDLTHS